MGRARILEHLIVSGTVLGQGTHEQECPSGSSLASSLRMQVTCNDSPEASLVQVKIEVRKGALTGHPCIQYPEWRGHGQAATVGGEEGIAAWCKPGPDRKGVSGDPPCLRPFLMR